jgi:putative ABC transport system permease protein
MIPLSYNVRSLMVRKATTLATALGIGLVVFVLASSQMLARGIKRTMGLSGSVDKAFVMRKGADAELSSQVEQRWLSAVLAAPGARRNARGLSIGSGELLLVIALEKADNATQISNVQLRGVADNVMELRPDVRMLEGRPARPGTDEVVIGRRLRGMYKGLKLGQRFEIKKNRLVEVVGVFEASGSSFESEVWADIETVRTSFGREGIVSSVTVALESSTKFDEFKTAIEHDKQLDLQVLREVDYFEKISESTATLVSFLGSAIVFFFSVGAMIGAMITMYGAVSNRKREIGTLRALGFGRGSVLLSFVLESLVLALLGGVLGAVGSLGMGMVEFSMMNTQTFSEMVFSFDATPQIVLGSVLAGGVMGILGGLFPAVRASRVSPVAAMRE